MGDESPGLSTDRGYPLQRCWWSVRPRFLHSGVAVAEVADSTFDRSRRARMRGASRIRASFAPPRLRSWGRGCPSTATGRTGRSTTGHAFATDELPRLVERERR